jgi:hypothetical protein
LFESHRNGGFPPLLVFSPTTIIALKQLYEASIIIAFVFRFFTLPDLFVGFSLCYAFVVGENIISVWKKSSHYSMFDFFHFSPLLVFSPTNIPVS